MNTYTAYSELLHLQGFKIVLTTNDSGEALRRLSDLLAAVCGPQPSPAISLLSPDASKALATAAKASAWRIILATALPMDLAATAYNAIETAAVGAQQ